MKSKKKFSRNVKAFLTFNFFLKAFALYLWSSLGNNAGAHRLWSHRAFKARMPLRLFLMIGQTMTMQRSVFIWARDHRIHHKYSDTSKDPYNSTRGFFYSHIGWVFMPKTQEVIDAQTEVYLADLTNDAVLKFQSKYYELLTVGLVAIFTIIPMYFWGETFGASFYICVWLRTAIAMNAAFAVNSFAHMYGNRPFDK